MIRPRKIQTYCSHCGQHTTHGIDRVKKHKASELKLGQRRFRRVLKGYRGYPRPKPEGREKPTRRVYIKYKCEKCGKSHQKKCIRAKKFEFKE